MGLLLLFPLTLLVIQLGMLATPPETGLLVYGLTYCFSVPIAMVRLTTGFVSGSYIKDLLPLLTIVWFYQTVAFMGDSDYRMIDQTITGILAIAALCLRSLKLPVILAVVIIAASWVAMQGKNHLNNRMALVCFTEMIVIILTYWN